jgi:hypothetical protein
VVEPIAPVQRITVGTFDGFVALYVQGFEGSNLTARIAGRWLRVVNLQNNPGQSFSLIRRNTGAGFLIRVEVWIDGVKQSLTVGGNDVGLIATVRTR